MANPITGFLNRIFNPNHDSSYYNPVVDSLLGISTENGGRSQFDVGLQTNVQEAEKNRLFQQQMVQEEREYNTPMAQMARARAAGLNPNLLYGQPISEAGSAPAGSEASVGMGSSGDLARLITGVPSMLADIELKRANARLSQEKAETEGYLRQARLDNLVSATESNYASVHDAISKIQQRVHQNALTDAEKENISFNQMIESGKLSINWQQLQNQTRMTDAQIDKLKADTEESLARAKVTNREYEEMIYTFAIRVAGLEKQNLLTDAKIQEAYATAVKLGIEGDRIHQIINLDTPKENYYTGKPSETGNPIAFEIRYSIGETIKALLGRL